MNIDMSLDDDSVLTINLAGRFDFACLAQFQELYQNLPKNPKQYIIDLSRVDYIDSSMLGLLLALKNTAPESGDNIEITLKDIKPAVRSILTVTKLDKIFTIV